MPTPHHKRGKNYKSGETVETQAGGFCQDSDFFKTTLRKVQKYIEIALLEVQFSFHTSQPLYKKQRHANNADDRTNDLTDSDFLMEEKGCRGNDEYGSEGKNCLGYTR